MNRPRHAPVAVLVELDSRRVGKTLRQRQAERGNHAVYRPGETNHCPGCGRRHWQVGRITAECCFCAAALPIASDGSGE